MTMSKIVLFVIPVLSNTTATTLVVWFLLTLSPPIPLRLYTLPYWSNPLFLIFDIWALWHSGLSRQSARMSKIKNIELDQYGPEPFKQQQFGTAGLERVNVVYLLSMSGTRPRVKQSLTEHIWALMKLLFLTPGQQCHCTEVVLHRSKLWSADHIM